MTQSEFEKCRTSKDSKSFNCMFNCVNGTIKSCTCKIIDNNERKGKIYRESNQAKLHTVIPTKTFTHPDDQFLKKCLEGDKQKMDLQIIDCGYDFTNGRADRQHSKSIRCSPIKRSSSTWPSSGIKPFEFYGEMIGRPIPYVIPTTTKKTTT